MAVAICVTQVVVSLAAVFILAEIIEKLNKK